MVILLSLIASMRAAMTRSFDLDRRFYRSLALAASVVLAATIAYLSLASSSGIPQVVWWDKAQHFVAYASLGLPLAIALGRARWRSAIAIAVAYGAIMEVAQGTLTTGRVADFYDAIANTCGACAGVATGYMLLGVLRGR